MASQFAALFADGFNYSADVGGETVTAYDSAGDSSSVTMICNRIMSGQTPDDYGGQTVSQIRAILQTSEIADIDGYTFGIDSLRWRISESSTRDGVHNILLLTDQRNLSARQGQFASE